jgi:hypothetical protein
MRPRWSVSATWRWAPIWSSTSTPAAGSSDPPSITRATTGQGLDCIRQIEALIHQLQGEVPNLKRLLQLLCDPNVWDGLNRLYALNAQLRPGDPYSVQLDVKADQLIDRLSLLRVERIEASRASLPWTFWLALFLGGAATIAMGASLYMRGYSVSCSGRSCWGW